MSDPNKIGTRKLVSAGDHETMALPFLMIDFENVQPKAIDRLKPGTARIRLFLGQNQQKMLVELARALQPFGADVDYIPITGSGPDAVDFHIAYYIGRLSHENPGAEFVIISKDRGFDPLVKHLEGQGIPCRRVPEIPELAGPVALVPAPKAPSAKPAPARKATAKPVATPVRPSTAKTGGARAQVVIDRLKKSTKPSTLAKLESSIRSYFSPPLDQKALAAVLQSLKDKKKIAVDGTKVVYSLG